MDNTDYIMVILYTAYLIYGPCHAKTCLRAYGDIYVRLQILRIPHNV